MRGSPAGERGIPAGRNAGVPRSPASCCSSSTTTLAWPRRRARAFRGAARRRPGGRRCSSCASPVPTGRRRATGCRGCGPATRRARATITRVWEGAVAIRRGCSSGVGGWPAEFRYAHEGIDLGWRVMDAGERVLYPGDIAALHPRYATAPHDYSPSITGRATGCGSPAATSAPARRAVRALFALRTLPLCRSRRAFREAARGYRDGLRAAVRAAAPLQAKHPVADDAEPGRPPIIAASLLARDDDRCPIRASSRERVHLRAHVYEPHKSACRRCGRTARGCGAGASSPARWRAPTCARSTTTRSFGQFWLVLNPLLLACVYFILVDILRGGPARAGLLRAPAGRAVRLLLRLGLDPRCRSSRSPAAGG